MNEGNMIGIGHRTTQRRRPYNAWSLLLLGVALAVLALGCNSGSGSGGAYGGSPTTTAAAPSATGATSVTTTAGAAAGNKVSIAGFAHRESGRHGDLDEQRLDHPHGDRR